jgi:hypothetical protein
VTTPFIALAVIWSADMDGSQNSASRTSDSSCWSVFMGVPPRRFDSRDELFNSAGPEGETDFLPARLRPEPEPTWEPPGNGAGANHSRHRSSTWFPTQYAIAASS